MPVNEMAETLAEQNVNPPFAKDQDGRLRSKVEAGEAKNVEELAQKHPDLARQARVATAAHARLKKLGFGVGQLVGAKSWHPDTNSTNKTDAERHEGRLCRTLRVLLKIRRAAARRDSRVPTDDRTPRRRRDRSVDAQAATRARRARSRSVSRRRSASLYYGRRGRSRTACGAGGSSCRRIPNARSTLCSRDASWRRSRRERSSRPFPHTWPTRGPRGAGPCWKRRPPTPRRRSRARASRPRGSRGWGRSSCGGGPRGNVFYSSKTQDFRVWAHLQGRCACRLANWWTPPYLTRRYMLGSASAAPCSSGRAGRARGARRATPPSRRS